MTRTMSRDRTAVGQEVEVRLRIVNEGPRIPSLEVFDNLPANLDVVKGRPHVHLELRPREVVEISYVIVPQVKGEYEIGPVLLRARETLGLRDSEERCY